MRIFVGSITLLCLFSCSEEIIRLDLVNPSSPSVNIECEKHRQVDFYLDGDIEFKDYPEMVLDFEFYKGNEQLLKGGLDPLKCSQLENEVKTVENGITHWKFYGKLEGNFIPPSDTIFTIYPTLIKNQTSDFKINKLELVFVR